MRPRTIPCEKCKGKGYFIIINHNYGGLPYKHEYACDKCKGMGVIIISDYSLI